MPPIIKASPANNFHYNKQLKTKSRELRNNATKAEIKLWSKALNGKQCFGYSFRRQRPVLYYIADFMCQELMLIIEVDGWTHHFEEVVKKDQKRQQDLEAIGFTVLRFDDNEVMNDFDNVLRVLEYWIQDFEEQHKEAK